MKIERFLGRLSRQTAVKLSVFWLIVLNAVSTPAQAIGHLGVDADPTPLVQARRPVRRVSRAAERPLVAVNTGSSSSSSNNSNSVPANTVATNTTPTNSNKVEPPKIETGGVKTATPTSNPNLTPPTAAYDRLLASAEAAVQQGKFEVALDAFQKARKERPDSLEAQLGVAESLFDLRRLPEAEREFRAILASQPQSGEAQRGLGDTLYDARRWRDSVAAYQAAIDTGLNDSAIYNNYANALFRTGTVENKAKAIQYYQKAIDLQPTWPSAYAGLANALRSQRGPDGKLRLDEALAAATKGVELGPELSLTHSILGRVYSDLGQFDRATSEGQRAVQISPKDPFVYLNLGGIYYAQKRFPEAEQTYLKAIELDPQWAFPYNALGSIYMNNLQRLGDASLQFSKALLLEPSSPTLHVNFGAARARAGDYNEAINQFQQAIALDPKSIAAHHNLGLLFTVQRRYPEAVGEFQKAIELDSTRPVYFIALGDTYKLMGKTREADEAYNRARNLGAKIDEPAKDAKSESGKKDEKKEKKKKN
jgi:tetratricopeptide (TPR) repeat protein